MRLQSLVVTPTIAALAAACGAVGEPPAPPSPTAALGAECFGSAAPTLGELSPGSTPAHAVSAYLEAGGLVGPLTEALFDRGWVTPTSAVIQIDVDGDGDLDLAAGLTGTPGRDGIAGSGSVYLWRCEDSVLARSAIAPPRPFPFPALREARDLTGDSLPELVVAYPRCGAHTCFAQFAVYQWDGSAMVDRFVGASDDLPSPEWSARADRPDGSSTIEITARGIASVGGGPYRVWSRAWTWDAAQGAFLPAGESIEAPRYRIHAVHEADDSFLGGDYPGALAMYRRVIDDEELLDWPGPGDGRAALAGYAAYRGVLTLLALGDRLAAEDEFERFFAAPPPEASAYAWLARLVLDTAPQGLAAACAAAQQYVEDHASEVLGPLDYGYANRTYDPVDVCPIL